MLPSLTQRTVPLPPWAGPVAWAHRSHRLAETGRQTTAASTPSEAQAQGSGALGEIGQGSPEEAALGWASEGPQGLGVPLNLRLASLWAPKAQCTLGAWCGLSGVHRVNEMGPGTLPGERM